MADPTPSPEIEKPIHRGRIQAQGGGTEKSESWAQATPPTFSEIVRPIDRLEAQLTPKEKTICEKAFTQLRRVVEIGAETGGFWAPRSRSFPKPATGDIRVDIEIITARAAVPDPDSTEKVE